MEADLKHCINAHFSFIKQAFFFYTFVQKVAPWDQIYSEFQNELVKILTGAGLKWTSSHKTYKPTAGEWNKVCEATCTNLNLDLEILFLEHREQNGLYTHTQRTQRDGCTLWTGWFAMPSIGPNGSKNCAWRDIFWSVHVAFLSFLSIKSSLHINTRVSGIWSPATGCHCTATGKERHV